MGDPSRALCKTFDMYQEVRFFQLLLSFLQMSHTKLLKITTSMCILKQCEALLELIKTKSQLVNKKSEKLLICKTIK